MIAATFGARLKRWRRANLVKQVSLAQDLGVTQAAISRWENEIDMPSPMMARRLAQIMLRTANAATLEVRFIEQQSTVRALLDLDGTRLLASSKGFKTLWPKFAVMTDIPMADFLIGESARLIHDHDYHCHLSRGKLVVVSGVSERHVNLDIDTGVRHRWHICTRSAGPKALVEMAFEPCDATTPTGIETFLFAEDLTA
jgi:transcriptional regulator with XRE-family HTH domain